MPISYSYTAILKKSINVSLSLGFSRFMQMASSFIGMIMVAHLGRDQLAASSLITPIQALIFVIGSSLISSVGILSAKEFGAKKYHNIGIIVRSGLFIGILLSIVFSIILFISPHILLSLDQPKVAITLATDYLYIFILAIPLFMFIFVFQQFLISVDRKRLVVIMGFLSTFFITCMSYILIYGTFGFHRLGIRGLAWSIVIWNLLSCIIYTLYILKTSYFYKFKIFPLKLTISIYQVKKILKVGSPIALQSTSDIFSFLIITIFVGWLGSDALAIQQIVTQYFLLFIVPILSLSQTSSILIAQSYGEKNIKNIINYGNIILTIGIILALFVMLIFTSFSNELILLYIGNDPYFTIDLLRMAAVILFLTGTRLFFDTIVEVKIGSLRGIFDIYFPMTLSLISAWIICVPLAYMLCFYLKFGLPGISIAYVTMMFINACVLYLRWSYKLKKIQF